MERVAVAHAVFACQMNAELGGLMVHLQRSTISDEAGDGQASRSSGGCSSWRLFPRLPFRARGWRASAPPVSFIPSPQRLNQRCGD
eukprot:6385122-Lingulodinium_polyedra.AAC.1